MATKTFSIYLLMMALCYMFGLTHPLMHKFAGFHGIKVEA